MRRLGRFNPRNLSLTKNRAARQDCPFCFLHHGSPHKRAGESLLHPQHEVVRPEDAAIPQPPRLAAGRELHQPRGERPRPVRIDRQRHALLTQDAVAVARGHVPHAPRHTLADLRHRRPLSCRHIVIAGFLWKLF